MVKHIFLCILVMVAVGCAQVHPGRLAQEVGPNGKVKDPTRSESEESDLIISAVEVTNLSSEYFGVIDFTFENTTGEWIEITDVELDFRNKKLNKGVSIPLGDKISLWAKAVRARNAIRAYNKQLIALALTAAGGAVASGSDNQNIQNLGSAAAVGGVSYLAVDSFGKTLDYLQHGKLVPRNYLIGNDILIPPGLFARYWILFYTKEPETLPYAESIYLSCNINGKHKEYKLDFRRRLKGSEWDQNS